MAPRYRDGQGNPVLFGRADLPGAAGAWPATRARGPLCQREPARVEWVELDLPMPEDVDTPDDYARIRARDASAGVD